MIERWIQNDVRKQPAYRVKTTDCTIKLNQNESPFDWPEDIKNEIGERIKIGSWNRYPDLIPVSLQEKIGKVNGVEKQQVILGKGSNEILQAIFTAVIRSGDEVCTLSPTFAVYKMLAEQKGAYVIESTLREDFTVNEVDLIDKAAHAKLTIICNPNSPTGSLVNLSLIEELLNHTTGLVVIDEAYVDFSGVTALELLQFYPNLILTRTFSKAFALAGFRIGFAWMKTELVQEVQKCLLPFNVDMPSCIALETILDHEKIVKKRAKIIIRERDRIIKEINEVEGMTAHDSSSNFFLLKSWEAPQKLFAYLGGKGILVRDVSSYSGLDSYLRITVGTPEENDQLVSALKERL